MSLVRLKTKSQVTIPDALRQQLGMQVGDLLEAKVHNGSIVLKPKVVVDRDEYTPVQRRQIDVQLAKSIAEHKKGKSYGPFETHEEMIDFLHQQVKQSRARTVKTNKRRV